MERRIKVWLGVLIALLVLAIVGVIVVNSQLSNSKVALEAASTQLAGELDKVETLTAENESVNAQLAQAQESAAAAESQLAQAQESAAAAESQLAQVQEKATDLESQLDKAQEESARLETQLSEAQAESQKNVAAKQTAEDEAAALKVAAEEYETRIAELEGVISAAQVRIAELSQADKTEPQSEDVSTGGVAVAPDPDVTAAPEGKVPEAEVSETEAPEIEVPEVKVPEAEVSETEAPEIEVPEAKVSETEAPEVEIPEVETPEILENAAQVNVDDIYADIDNIVAGADGDMTDAEKIEALDALKQELGVYVEELNAALAEISDQENALLASADSIAALENELVAAQENVDALSEAIAASQSTIAELEGQVETLSAQNENDSAEAQAQIDALNAAIEEEKARAEALTAELAAANARLENLLAELEVYKLARELGAGEAYTASTLEGTLLVDADGKTVRWTYTNDTISGNTVVLTILVDGEEMYRSEALEPGASISGFELVHALEAGEHAAVAVTGVYDAEGNLLHSTRVPVEIKVG